ncbi:hypothetical protein GYH30_039994 [Glycine max]|nr:hypothetical protein GYH30_039994 [Glycine max]
MALILHATKANKNSFKTLIAAEYSGVQVELDPNFEMGGVQVELASKWN